jgi:chemotaxis protein methyltransferase WspC
VRQLADAGRVAEALALLRDARPPHDTADGFSLLGVLLQASGRPAEATAAFRKALYLDPDHPEALSHMILLCEQRGDAGQAAALRRRLARTERGAKS